jgi:chloramphenicol O-acetyltransferase type A
MQHQIAKAPQATEVNLETYARRWAYEHFITFDVPVVSRTIQLDITKLRIHNKKHKLSFMLTFGFLVTKAMNDIPEFHHRIQNDLLVDFDRVIPSFTALTANNIICFAKGDYSGNFNHDYEFNADRVARAKRGLDQDNIDKSQGQIFITNIPWYSFTSIHHPYSKNNASIPIISTGKIYQENDHEKIPFAIQTHHALVDGYHIGLFMEKLEHFLENPHETIAAQK